MIEDELIALSCPSIAYRTRLEILSHSALEPGMADLQDQILQDEAVREVISWQQPDGWLAENFHGSKSIEAGIRLLCEKGLSRFHPVLANALAALERETGRLHLGIGKPGKLLDEMELGGSQMIRAAVFAFAGLEEKPFIKEQIEIALRDFKSVLAVETIGDLAEPFKDKLVFRPHVQWPGIYHLRLMARTFNWRNPENLDLMVESIKRLVKLSPIPHISARYKSQIIAPASFCMNDFNPNIAALDDANWMMWFHRMELLARLGIIHRVPELEGQIACLAEILDGNEGWFARKLNHEYFRKWGPYTGLALEKDWKLPQRRINDLTFRSLLILHYYGNSQSDKAFIRQDSFHKTR
jgi:hypothetical protein